MKLTQEEIKELDVKRARQLIEDRVYEACQLIERLEGVGKISGNGHHARQKLAAIAGDDLERRWRA